MFQAPNKISSSLPKPRAQTNGDFRKTGSSVIGSDLSIKGDVHSDGPLIINGKVTGDVNSRTLTVKEGGTIEGNVSANEVMVFGKIFGTIRARELRLRPSSHVEGDIYHEQLEIEMGTNFSGKLTRAPFKDETEEKAPKDTSSQDAKEVEPKDTGLLPNKPEAQSPDHAAHAQ